MCLYVWHTIAMFLCSLNVDIAYLAMTLAVVSLVTKTVRWVCVYVLTKDSRTFNRRSIVGYTSWGVYR